MFGIKSRKTIALEAREQALKEMTLALAEKSASLEAKSAQFDANNVLAQQLFAAFNMQLYRNTGIFNYDLKTFVQEGYVENPHVHKVINEIIQPAKSVPFCTYIVKDKKAFNRYKGFVKEGRVDEAELFARKSLELVDGTPMNTMYEDRPNEYETWPEFIEAALGYKLLTGNRFLYGLESAGFKYFTKLYNLPAQITEIITDGWRQPVKGYKLYLTPTYIEQFTAESVLHQKSWNPSFNSGYRPQNFLYGLSPMEPLCKVVRRSNESITASYYLLKNGGPPGIISSDGETPIDNVEEMEEAYIRKFGGGIKKGIPLFSSGNLKWIDMGLGSAELELLPADVADLKNIAGVYKVPLPLVSDEKSTYNNMIEAEKALWAKAIVPALISFRDGFNQFVTALYNRATGKQYWCDFDFKAVPALQDDQNTKSERLLKEMRQGIWTGNEFRRMMDQDEDPTNEFLNQNMLSSDLRFIKLEDLPEKYKVFMAVTNGMSPLVANNVITSMTETEIRELIALGALPAGQQTINQMLNARGQQQQLDPAKYNEDGTAKE